MGNLPPHQAYLADLYTLYYMMYPVNPDHENLWEDDQKILLKFLEIGIEIGYWSEADSDIASQAGLDKVCEQMGGVPIIWEKNNANGD